MIIKLENIKNVRDLGGMRAADSKKIKAKRLIRSSKLWDASEKDIKTITEKLNVVNVVDFRTETERAEDPHPIHKFPNIQYHFLKSYDTTQEIVTRDKKSNYLLMKNANKLTEDMAVEIIEDFYKQMPSAENLQKAYAQFFEVLLNTKKGATLWHCSLGKDRAGIAAVLVEHALGVSDEDIMKDYMLTNKYLEEITNKDMTNAFRVFYGVRESFLESWYESVDQKFGGIDKFLKDVLKVDEKKIEKLRKMYLE